MRKKIHKIWGVGLVLVLAVSLLFSAAPASAGTLSWSTETIPSTTGNVLVTAGDVTDIAVYGDGDTIWAASGTTKIYKSTDGGATWTSMTPPDNCDADLVAVAPDDPDIAVFADTDNVTVYITTNGGSTWGSLGTIQQSGGYGAANTIKDIAISAASAGVHYVAVAGAEAGGVANVWYFNAGAAAPAWKEAQTKDGVANGWSSATLTAAVAFSPNFASDQVMVVVTGNNTDAVDFQIFSMNKKQWNTTAGFTGYPVEIVSTSGNLTSASIALSPEYLGSDDVTRIAFVGLDISGDTTNSGVWRLKDTSVKGIDKGKRIYSVAYDGANLAAGSSSDTNVRRCSDPLATTPTFSSTSSLKRPGGENKVVVAWAGADLVAGTSGNESAFAISKDNGKSFNDVSLIYTSLNNLEDVAVAADGSKVYLGTNDGTDFSLWRKASSWERVLSVKGNTGFIVRIAPDDPDVVYVADTGSGATTIYYTSTAGETKWFTRTFRYTEGIQDLAVEGEGDVAYVALYGKATVSKTTNAGFTWGSAKSTKLSSGNVHMIASLGEDKVIVGSTAGYVSYSTDGNSSWTPIKKSITSGNVSVTASGLATDDYIYAATSAANDYIYRWQIGTSTSWKKISSALGTGYRAYGIVLWDGVLYAVASDGTDSKALRTLNPTAGSVTWSTLVSTGETFTAEPSALKVSSGSTKLWAINSAATPGELFSYTDTLTEAGPTLRAPKMGTIVAINRVSGKAYDVTFSWERLSKADNYQLEIALDPDFKEAFPKISFTNDTITDVPAQIVGPSGTDANKIEFMPGTTYYWRVRVSSTEADATVYSPWSEVRSFAIASLPEPTPPVVVEEAPPPVLELPQPEITLQPPEIVLPEPPPPPPEIVIPPAPPPPAPITPAYIWAIIIIGAILVIAVIVLIVRTRRPV